MSVCKALGMMSSVLGVVSEHWPGQYSRRSRRGQIPHIQVPVKIDPSHFQETISINIRHCIVNGNNAPRILSLKRQYCVHGVDCFNGLPSISNTSTGPIDLRSFASFEASPTTTIA